ncbi:MAG: PKD domain-containing protein, partial [Chloroflexi bacterium]|nr:PKD domain-containing protein [Chloroflexota bacterium]
AIIIAMMILLCAACKPAAPIITPSSVLPANSAPVIVSIIGIQEWKPSTEGNLTCDASDPDGDKLNYIWTAENGTIKGEGNKVIWVTPDSTGNYAVTVRVTDGKGGEATASKSFKVVTNPYGNDSPDTTIYLKFAMPSTSLVQETRRVRTWTTWEIQCVVQDTDANELTYEWSSPAGKLNGNGLAEGKASRTGWTTPGVAGTYTVSVTITDKAGNKAKGEVTFETLCCRD